MNLPPYVYMPNKKELYLLMTASALCLLFFLLVLTLLPQPKIKDNWVIGATQFDSELGWIPIPNVVIHLFNQAYIQHNSLGFRSDELSSSKSTILVVGDSIVWGYGVSNNETVTYYLQEALPDFQVLNLGVPGYGIDQYYLYLKKNIEKTNPVMIIVVLFTGNDLQDTTHDTAYGKSKPLFIPENGKLQLTGVPISHYSCANFLFSRWIINYLDSLKPRLSNLCKTRELNTQEQDQVITGLLQSIQHLADQHHTPLLFVLSPMYADFQTKSNNLLYFENLFQNTTYLYIDQYVELLKTNKSLKEVYFDPTIDGYHYTAWGNWYLAKTLYQHLPFNKVEH